MAVAILGVVLLLSPTDGSKKDGSGVSVPKNATNPSASVNYVVEPPSDIAGRCSPSNLPGSIPACLEACYPASCCYIMSDSGNKCWNIIMIRRVSRRASNTDHTVIFFMIHGTARQMECFELLH
jgi:hypothetical protein